MNFFVPQAKTKAVIPAESNDMVGLAFMVAPSIGLSFFTPLKPRNTPNPFLSNELSMGFRLRCCIRLLPLRATDRRRVGFRLFAELRPLADAFLLCFATDFLLFLCGFPAAAPNGFSVMRYGGLLLLLLLRLRRLGLALRRGFAFTNTFRVRYFTFVRVR